MKSFIFILGLLFSLNLYSAEFTEIYSCEQFFSLPDNGMNLKVLKNSTDQTFKIEVSRTSAGKTEVETYQVDVDSTQVDGYPIIFKSANVMLKISNASMGDDNKKLATLITYEGGEPDSESMKCEAKSALL